MLNSFSVISVNVYYISLAAAQPVWFIVCSCYYLCHFLAQC